MQLCTKCNLQRPKADFIWNRKVRYSYQLTYCKECLAKQKREGITKTPERFLQYLYHKTKARCKISKMAFTITLEELLEQYKKQNGYCFYTTLKLEHKNGYNDYNISLDRVNNSNGYISGNVVICCRRINRIKGDLFLDEMQKWTPDWFERAINFLTK